MSIPEGYAVAPTSADHICKLAIPVPGRDKTILVEVPQLNWMPPADIKKYGDWLTPITEAEETLLQWGRDNANKTTDEKSPTPVDAQKVYDGFNKKEMTLRWLKPYVTAAEYKTLMSDVPGGTIQWIGEQLNKSDDVTVGESSASTDS